MKPFVIASIAPIIWGSSYLLVSLYLPEQFPLHISLLRTLPIGLLFLLLAGRIPALSWIKKAAMISFLGSGLFYLLQTVGSFLVPSSIIGVIIATTPIQALIIQSISQKTSPPIAKVVACFFVLLGMFLVFAPGFESFNFMGIALILTSCMSYVFSVFFMKKWELTASSSLAMVGWFFTLGGLWLLLPCIYLENTGDFLQSMDSQGFFALLILAVVNTGISTFIFFSQVSKISLTNLGFLGLINPIAAILYGYLFADEVLDVYQWMGITIIFASLIINISLDLFTETGGRRGILARH